MNRGINEKRELRLEDLKPFGLATSQTYEGDRLEQLMNSIERLGLRSPITVRPTDDGKYEIICGHNRVNAMRKLGYDVILAEVCEGLPDDKAIEMFYDSNLNQQSFSDWNYSQKIKAVQYTERLIKENSQQGRRNDLVEKQEATTEEGTSVQSRHKSDGKSRRDTTRDRMSRRLGIATTTLSKYRSIIKLPEDLVEVLSQMLDEKKITFEATYRMSLLKDQDVRKLVKYIEDSPNKKIDLTKLKELCATNRAINSGKFPRMLSSDELKAILVDREPLILKVHRKGKEG